MHAPAPLGLGPGSPLSQDPRSGALSRYSPSTARRVTTEVELVSAYVEDENAVDVVANGGVEDEKSR